MFCDFTVLMCMKRLPSSCVDAKRGESVVTVNLGTSQPLHFLLVGDPGEA